MKYVIHITQQFRRKKGFLLIMTQQGRRSAEEEILVLHFKLKFYLHFLFFPFFLGGGGYFLGEMAGRKRFLLQAEDHFNHFLNTPLQQHFALLRPFTLQNKLRDTVNPLHQMIL